MNWLLISVIGVLSVVLAIATVPIWGSLLIWLEQFSQEQEEE